MYCEHFLKVKLPKYIASHRIEYELEGGKVISELVPVWGPVSFRVKLKVYVQDFKHFN